VLGLRGPRVAASSGLVARRFQHPAGYRNCPPLSGPLRCASAGASLLGLLRATCVFVRHFLYRKPRAEVNWGMGVYAPFPPRNLSSRSRIAFSKPQGPSIPYQDCEREPNVKSDRAPAICLWDKGNMVKNTSIGHKIDVCVRRRNTRMLFLAPNRWRKRASLTARAFLEKSLQSCTGEIQKNQICILPRARCT
jgi:hypothetical protein